MSDKFKEDSFYEHESSEQILCGACVIKELDKTEKGVYKGDEGMHAAEFRYLNDQDTEPYQCDGCNEQNDAYDSVLDDGD